ncbi:MAG: hypothetical protein M3P98_04315 [bacterium]|nr:hypothetical protein [bacterium]
MSLIPKRYFHDRWALLFLTINSFLVGLISVAILLRLDSAKGEGYITQYRSNLGVNQFQSGEGTVFLTFIAFSVLVLVISTMLSMKVYENHRQYAISALGMCLMLLVMVFFVSNALLAQG